MWKDKNLYILLKVTTTIRSHFVSFLKVKLNLVRDEKTGTGGWKVTIRNKLYCILQIYMCE